MEKPTDKSNNGNGSTAPGRPQAEKDSPALTVGAAAETNREGPPAESAAGVERLELTAELAKEMERPSGTAQDTAAAFKPGISERDCPNSKPLVTTSSNPHKICTLEMNHQCSTKASVDMDCLVCFNKYNIYRVPKLLDCQHAFCAVCLKLILRKEESSWIITCPLCRKATSVSGGLIRTLPNKEDIMELLQNSNSNPEVSISVVGLDSNSWTQTSQDALYRDENAPADNKLAIQRLMLLLLLVVILTILILPFMYSGMIKWVICIMLILGLVMSVVLCCTPKFYWRCGRDPLSSRNKETHIAAIA
ncbi:E3 ubiquitin-protein ligase RNF186 [Colius striatus]|uniref:E3 ubiquitin-protein ligase RNF186 n=1 Tax=Colius striatus TaxID=57412 RepID=UPI002B1D244D|nr:E3 ubiquitin-protein ligase RNF186 [Colius striatus]